MVLRKLWAFLPGVMLIASVAGATPVTLHFDTVNPKTSRSEVWLTVTLVEGAGGVGMFARLNPGIDLWEGWKFDRLWLDDSGDAAMLQWTSEDLERPVWLSGYTLDRLSGLWFYARWAGPCDHCDDTVELPEQEWQLPQTCDIVLRERFRTRNVPEPAATSIVLVGISAVAFLRSRRSP